MLEALELLASLQDADLRLKEIEDALGALPAKLESMRRDVSTVEKLLEEERSRLAEAQSYRLELERSQKYDQESLLKTKGKLPQIRTSKEYMAVQREFETKRKVISERQEEIDRLSETLAATEQSIGKHEVDLGAAQAEINAEEEDIKREIGVLRGRHTTESGQRKVLAENVEASLLRRYDNIRRVREGIAVVPAIGGVCKGCQMHLPPQLYNILQQGDTIEQCQNCQRIVYCPPHASSTFDPPDSANARTSLI